MLKEKTASKELRSFISNKGLNIKLLTSWEIKTIKKELSSINRTIAKNERDEKRYQVYESKWYQFLAVHGYKTKKQLEKLSCFDYTRLLTLFEHDTSKKRTLERKQKRIEKESYTVEIIEHVPVVQLYESAIF